MTKILISVISIPIVLAFLNHFGVLPDIPQSAFDNLAEIFRWLWFLNRYFPIDTFFTYVGYILTIEITLWILHVADTFRGAATGAKPLFKDFK